MLRYCMILYLLMRPWPAYANLSSDDWLQTIFDATKYPNKTIENIKCNNIESLDSRSLNGCYNCFTCSNERFLRHKYEDDTIQRLRLTDDNCESEEICCVSQIGSSSTRSPENCGNINPEGKPRRERPTLRSVLRGQYPWRAWIYNGEDKVCAATFIHDGYNVLVASATCMYHFSDSENLNVKFDRNSTVCAPITRIEIHKDFEVGLTENNIALIKLEFSLKFLHSVCLPKIAAYPGTPCVVVSEDDISIHAVIPNQNKCNLKDPDTLCAVIPRNDYIPELGSGLYCLDENAQKPSYLLYGIMYDNVENIILFTNISYHFSWINNQIMKLNN